MFSTVADLGVPIILMHIRGTPATMQQHTDYVDLISEIYDFLERQIETALALQDRAVELGKQARAFVEANCDWEAITDQFEQLLLEQAARQP